MLLVKISSGYVFEGFGNQRKHFILMFNSNLIVARTRVEVCDLVANICPNRSFFSPKPSHPVKQSGAFRMIIARIVMNAELLEKLFRNHRLSLLASKTFFTVSYATSMPAKFKASVMFRGELPNRFAHFFAAHRMRSLNDGEAVTLGFAFACLGPSSFSHGNTSRLLKVAGPIFSNKR